MDFKLFNEIKKVGAQRFLYDSTTAGTRRRQARELQGVINDALQFMQDSDFPCNLEDVLSVLQKGKDGLLAVVWRRADQEAERLKIQRNYVLDTWREAERRAVTPEQWEEADNLFHRYRQNADGMPFDPAADIEDKEGRLVLNEPAIVERIESASSIEIDTNAEKVIGEVRDLAAAVRRLELTGLNACEFLTYLVSHDSPDDVELARRYYFRRHTVGTIHSPEIDMLINNAALKQLK